MSVVCLHVYDERGRAMTSAANMFICSAVKFERGLRISRQIQCVIDILSMIDSRYAWI